MQTYLDLLRDVLKNTIIDRRVGATDDIETTNLDSRNVEYLYTDNEGHWSNPEADRLATAARREPDANRRNELLRELHKVVNDEQPIALLAYPLVAILFNKHIQNAEPGPRGLWPERFWVPPEFQRR